MFYSAQNTSFCQVLLRVANVELQVALAEVLREIENTDGSKSTQQNAMWLDSRSTKVAICVAHLRDAMDYLSHQGAVLDEQGAANLTLSSDALKGLFETVEKGIEHLFDFLESLEPVRAR
jgi:hypothetical protein